MYRPSGLKGQNGLGEFRLIHLFFSVPKPQILISRLMSPDGAAWIFFLTPMQWLEPTSVELHQTFQTLYRLSYYALAPNYIGIG